MSEARCVPLFPKRGIFDWRAGAPVLNDHPNPRPFRGEIAVLLGEIVYIIWP